MIQQAIISALHKIGPMLKQELISITKAEQSDITKALNSGLIEHAEEYGDVTYKVSRKGCLKYGLQIRNLPIAKAKNNVPAELYDGADLKLFDGRPGCNDALELPSRQFNTLFYRNGETETLWQV